MDVKVTKLIKDDYFKKEFLQRVSKRGSEVMNTKGISSVMPAGKALCDHLYDWYHGTKDSCISMAVCSDGCYGLEKGIYCSLPVCCKGNF